MSVETEYHLDGDVTFTFTDDAGIKSHVRMGPGATREGTTGYTYAKILEKLLTGPPLLIPEAKKSRSSKRSKRPK